MTLEVSLRGVKCNLACTYCYQDPLRVAGAVAPKLDMKAVLKTIEEEMSSNSSFKKEGFTIFGGDPLLAPLSELEVLWKYGLSTAGKNGIQTNGALITDEHMAAFKRYRVHVGFSIDGPGELNRARWAGSVQRTDEATERSITALERCLKEKVSCSLIITIHRLNATVEHLPVLLLWLETLDSLGLTDARIHVLEIDGPEGKNLALSQEENVAAMKQLQRLEMSLKRLKFDVFKDMLALLRGRDREVTCIWNACDPWTTPAVRGVEADGSRSNCQRANKDGVNWQKGAKTTYRRQISLYHTPQADGGCKDCRFFMMCKGQCPGTAIDGDWRNRSRDCATWMGIFEHLEQALMGVGERPVSLHPERKKAEQAMIGAFAENVFMNVETAVAVAEGRFKYASPTNNAPHGDSPHGDWHGDHTDVHTDTQHTNGHDDVPPPETYLGKVHSDAPHADGHPDVGPSVGDSQADIGPLSHWNEDLDRDSDTGFLNDH